MEHQVTIKMHMYHELECPVARYCNGTAGNTIGTMRNVHAEGASKKTFTKLVMWNLQCEGCTVSMLGGACG